jgi:hypothetical protein
MLRCADGKMLHMTNKRFMLTIPADDYEAIRAAAFTHGTQPAVEARNLLLTQLRDTGTLTAGPLPATTGPAISGTGNLTAHPVMDTCSACGQPMLVSRGGASPPALHTCTAQTTATEDTTEKNR